jgi:hypothetical protein
MKGSQKVAEIPTDGLGVPVQVFARHELKQDAHALGLKILEPLKSSPEGAQ